MPGLQGRRIVCLCAAIVGSQLVGCGNPYQTAAVRGRVTCQGKPVPGATVEFRPIDAPEETGRPKGNPGNPSTGTVGEDGWFTLAAVAGKPGEGAVVGRHRVLFKMPPTQRHRLSGEDRAVMSPEEIKEWEEKLSRQPIYPQPPCGANITPGEVEVKRGSNEFEFTLQPK